MATYFSATLLWNDQVLLCHGTPGSDLEYFLETVSPDGGRAATVGEVEQRADLAPMSLTLCGHTNISRIAELADGRIVVNPGSVGLQAFGDESPFPHCLETGSPHARYAVIKHGLGGWDVEFVSVAYDWESAARLAESRNRPDWAHALRTGTAP